MKKNFSLAFMSAIALTGAMTFSACSSSDEIVDNPDFNPETNSVKTTITLNIDPNNSQPATRQSTTITQAEGSFRGMQSLYLFTASTAIDASTAFDACLELDAISSDELSKSQSSKIYANQEVKVGTNHFLFYGKATKLSDTSAPGLLANGHAETTLDATDHTPSEITFSAASIVPKGSEGFSTGWTGPVTDLTRYLNLIAQASDWKNSSSAQLSFLYNNFTKAGVARAGSAKAVLATIQDLYRAVYPISVGDGVDAASKTVAANILNAIKNETYVTWDATLEGPDIVFSWVSAFDSNFPVSLGLPEGAAQYSYSVAGTTAGFSYLEEPVLNASTATPIQNYVYPNELFYLTNTTLKATTSAVAAYPTTVESWRDQAWDGWSSTVEANTKNIAVENNIQYGSALLATQVRCTTATYSGSAVLFDNAKANGAEENKPIVYSENMFPLTAVIIGGQPSQVGWDFLPTSTASFNRDVYDGTMSTSIYAKNDAFSSSNYTLVYDNLASGGTQSDVNICLEFTNNSGSDFYGKDGVIMKGQKFYLVAALKLSTGTGDLDFTEDKTFFPSTVKRIFIQDFVTTAKINLKAGDSTTPGAIGEAIPTIPDLRTSQQSLGLSVDLIWRKGLTFDVQI